MSDDVRLWLVERTYSDRDLVRMVYATPDGNRYLQREVSSSVLRRSGGGSAAAIVVPDDRVETVADPADSERYAAEASRMADEHEPDDAV